MKKNAASFFLIFLVFAMSGCSSNQSGTSLKSLSHDSDTNKNRSSPTPTAKMENAWSVQPSAWVTKWSLEHTPNFEHKSPVQLFPVGSYPKAGEECGFPDSESVNYDTNLKKISALAIAGRLNQANVLCGPSDLADYLKAADISEEIVLAVLKMKTRSASTDVSIGEAYSFVFHHFMLRADLSKFSQTSLQLIKSHILSETSGLEIGAVLSKLMDYTSFSESELNFMASKLMDGGFYNGEAQLYAQRFFESDLVLKEPMRSSLLNFFIKTHDVNLTGIDDLKTDVYGNSLHSLNADGRERAKKLGQSLTENEFKNLNRSVANCAGFFDCRGTASLTDGLLSEIIFSAALNSTARLDTFLSMQDQFVDEFFIRIPQEFDLIWPVSSWENAARLNSVPEDQLQEYVKGVVTSINHSVKDLTAQLKSADAASAQKLSDLKVWDKLLSRVRFVQTFEAHGLNADLFFALLGQAKDTKDIADASSNVDVKNNLNISSAAAMNLALVALTQSAMDSNQLQKFFTLLIEEKFLKANDVYYFLLSVLNPNDAPIPEIQKYFQSVTSENQYGNSGRAFKIYKILIRDAGSDSEIIDAMKWFAAREAALKAVGYQLPKMPMQL